MVVVCLLLQEETQQANEQLEEELKQKEREMEDMQRYNYYIVQMYAKKERYKCTLVVCSIYMIVLV